MHVTLPRSWWWSMGLVLVVALTVSLLLPGPATDISSVYDNAGHLAAVIDPTNDTAIYAHDGVGNPTGIPRRPSSTFAALPFTLSASLVGTMVTTCAMGFTLPPASNTVKFNTATVLTTSTTTMTATVPSGAPTSLVSVTQH